MICRARVLTAVVAVVVVLGAATSGALAQADDVADHETAASTAQIASGSASFADRSISVTRGDTLTVTVSHSATAHLNLGSRENGFLLDVTLPGSGTHTVTIDTYNSTGDPRTYVSGGGNVTLHTHPLTRPLAAGTYLMNVTVDGVERDIGRVVIEERRPMNATTAVAPGSLATTAEGDPVDVTLGAVLGAATRRTTVAKGDLAVIAVNESGLENAFDPNHLSGDAASNGIEVRFTERDEPPNTQPLSFTASASTVRVFPDFEHDRIVFVWDTSTARLPDGVRNHTYDVTFRLNGATNDLVEEDVVEARTRVDLVPARVGIRAQSRSASGRAPGFTVMPWEERTVAVAGRTTLAPGSTLDVRARSASKTNPFLRAHRVTVDGNGTFGATFDFSSVARGTSFPLWVLGHRERTERTVRLHEERATLNFTNQERTGDAVVVRNVSLAAGGFVGIVDGNATLGASDYLAPGIHGNVTVTLADPPNRSAELTAVAFLDRNGSRVFEPDVDVPYTRDAGDGRTHTQGGYGNDLNETNGSDRLRIADSAIVWTTDGATGGANATTVATTVTTPAVTATTPGSTTTLHVQPETPIEPVVATGASVPFSPLLAVVAFLAAGLVARRTRQP